MKKIIVAVGCVLAIQACSGAGGGDGGAAKTSAVQTVTSSTVGGSVTNSAGNATGGAGGAGGTATNTVTVNLALDPAAFASLFGNISKISNPTPAQVSQVAQYATATGNSALKAKTDQCQGQPSSCEITKAQ